MYVELDEIKQHLNIDLDFTDDDSYLMSLEEVCETIVSKHIDCDFSLVIAENGGDFPPPLRLAILTLIGNFYNNRESVSAINAYELPLNYNYIIDLYKDYRWKK